MLVSFHISFRHRQAVLEVLDSIAPKDRHKVNLNDPAKCIVVQAVDGGGFSLQKQEPRQPGECAMVWFEHCTALGALVQPQVCLCYGEVLTAMRSKEKVQFECTDHAGQN